MIADKIKSAVESMRNKNKDCSSCKHKSFCDETKDYTDMTFCRNTAYQIINAINNTGADQ